MAKPVNIFIIYAREDKEEKKILLDFLSPMIGAYNLTIWHDDHIHAGQDWRYHIESRLTVTDIFILLVSVHFLNSKFINQVEFKYALDRHKENKSIVIPVIIKHCPWDEPLPYDNYSFSLSQLQVLPTDGKPIVAWKSADEAYNDIAKGIKSVIVDRIKNQKQIELLEDESWYKVNQQNTVASYRQYIESYPTGRYLQEAQSALLVFEEQERSERNRQDLENAKNEAERKQVEEEILWTSAVNAHSKESYENYIKKSKLSSHNGQAKSAIEAIEKANLEAIAAQNRLEVEAREHEIWQHANEENTMAGFQQYLLSTKLGLFKQEAHERISGLEVEKKREEQELWEQTSAENSVNAYDNYSVQFPNGKYRNEAVAAIEILTEKPQLQHVLAPEYAKGDALVRKSRLRKMVVIGGSVAVLAFVLVIAFTFNPVLLRGIHYNNQVNKEEASPAILDTVVANQESASASTEGAAVAENLPPNYEKTTQLAEAENKTVSQPEVAAPRKPTPKVEAPVEEAPTNKQSLADAGGQNSRNHRQSSQEEDEMPVTSHSKPTANTHETYNLEPYDCDKSPNLRSLHTAGNSSSIIFRNNTKKVIFVNWLDFNGEISKDIGVIIGPQGSSEVKTFDKHCWIVHLSRNCYGIYRAISKPSTVTIE